MIKYACFFCLVHRFQDWRSVRIYPIWRNGSFYESSCCCSYFRKVRFGGKEFHCYFRSTDWLVLLHFLLLLKQLSNFYLDFGLKSYFSSLVQKLMRLVPNWYLLTENVLDKLRVFFVFYNDFRWCRKRILEPSSW